MELIQFMEKTLSMVVDPEDIIWDDQYTSCEKELIHACRPSWLDRAGEDMYNYNDLLTCEFEVNTKNLGVKNVTLYNFINTCNQCESFTVRAQLMGDDDILSRHGFGEVVLSIVTIKSTSCLITSSKDMVDCLVPKTTILYFIITLVEKYLFQYS